MTGPATTPIPVQQGPVVVVNGTLITTDVDAGKRR